MNILVMPSWYPNEKDPINGSFFREQALALLKYGHSVIVLDTTFQGRQNYRGKNVLRLRHYFDAGLEVFSFQIPAFGISRTPEGGEFIYSLVAERIIRKIVQKVRNIDVIHAHSFLPAGLAACRIGKKMNIPVVVTEHSSGVLLDTLKKTRCNMLTRTVEEASCYICVSNKLKDAVLNITGTMKKIQVIPNSVNSMFFTSDDKRDCKDFIFLSVGRLDSKKRYDLLIKAFGAAFKKMEHIKLHIIGGGVCFSKLEKLIHELCLENQVMLEGCLPREKVANSMQRSSAFVLSSACETFGVVYVEALAAGLPVIGTKNGGAEDIINDKNGLLIDVDNQEQLEDAFRYMYKNIEKYNRREISCECKMRYSEKEIARRLTEIYNSLKSINGYY